MPEPICEFGIISSIDEKYIIIIGGNRDNGRRYNIWNQTDDIWIFDIKNNKFIKSKIKCPSKEKFKAVSVVNQNYLSLLTFGYIHNLEKQIVFFNIIPLEIIELIYSMVRSKTIYIMEADGMPGAHWKIDINHLLADDYDSY